MTEAVDPRLSQRKVRRADLLTAAFVSMVTMPLTAIFFFLIGSGLVIGALIVGLLRGGALLGRIGCVGLGLLVGPAIYVILAIAQ